MNRCICRKRTQAGTTLIEVLVSILVVSVGLLGLAGLFANSLKSTNEGYLYSQVVALTYDMADRIRANPSAITAYASTPPATLSKDCLRKVCTPAELASYDLYTWKQQLDAVLPSPTPTITVEGRAANIKMQWQAGGQQTNTFQLDMTL